MTLLPPRMGAPGGSRSIEYASTAPQPEDNPSTGVFAIPDESGGGLFAVVEGIPPAAATFFFERVREAVLADQGTPAARVLRAARHGCQALEAQALHRFELSRFGFTALRID